MTIVHELQKYRFMQVRKSLDCCSAFDAQIEKLVSNRRVYILSELENISDNSAFGQIHYETELLLDHTDVRLQKLQITVLISMIVQGVNFFIFLIMNGRRNLHIQNMKKG